MGQWHAALVEPPVLAVSAISSPLACDVPHPVCCCLKRMNERVTWITWIASCFMHNQLTHSRLIEWLELPVGPRIAIPIGIVHWVIQMRRRRANVVAIGQCTWRCWRCGGTARQIGQLLGSQCWLLLLLLLSRWWCCCNMWVKFCQRLDKII